MTLNELNDIDLSGYKRYLSETMIGDFMRDAGYEHYRLLNYVCKGKGLAYDIGTYRGSSAIAMSSAKKVISYDIRDGLEAKKPKNVTFKIGEAMEDKNILKADVILLDTFHEGDYEYEFYQFLQKGFKGLLICDDIKLNKAMEEFWGRIIHPKEDMTAIGHYSGTGFVYFNKRIKRCGSCG